jgi:uncharacterized protein YbjT (DUF2867 family)
LQISNFSAFLIYDKLVVFLEYYNQFELINPFIMEHKRNILVTGGNGFVGATICVLAAQERISIVSISRSGAPNDQIKDAAITTDWAKADVFQPESWACYLGDCGAVIHCIGIIEEEPSRGITYDRMIFQSAKLVADQAIASGIARFVFLSAGGAAPETPPAYMEAKERADRYLTSLGFASLSILKPGMIYGAARPETVQEAKEFSRLLADPVLGPRLRPVRPLEVHVVARAALRAAIDGTIHGVFDVDKMEVYGS